VVLGITMPVRT